MAEKLTDARVRGAKPKAARYSIMDAREPGLELRVCKNGAKVFALRASIDGKDARLRIGLYGPGLSLEDARERARELKSRLESNRAFGTFLFPNALGAFTALGIPFLVVASRVALQRLRGSAADERVAPAQPNNWFAITAFFAE